MNNNQLKVKIVNNIDGLKAKARMCFLDIEDKAHVAGEIYALNWVLEQLEIDRRKADPSQG